MKKLFTKLGFAVAIAAFALPAYAIPDPVPSADELPEFNLFDQEITVPSPSDRTIYRYNPTTNGTMTIYYGCQEGEMYYNIDNFIYTTYTSAAPDAYECSGSLTREDPQGTPEYDAEKGYACNFLLTGGTQYYIAIPNWITPETPKIYITWTPQSADVDPEGIASVSVTPGSLLDYSDIAEIQISGTKGITSIGDAYLIYNSEKISLSGNVTTNGPSGSQFIQVGGASNTGFQTLVTQAANAGASSITIQIENVMAGGVLVTYSDIQDNTYITVDEGTVSITYLIQPAAQYLLAESSWPASFYANGNDVNDAILKFSKDIKSISSVTVYCGNFDPNDEPTGEDDAPTLTQYTITPTINGTDVTLSFAGKTYSSSDGEITVVVTYVTDTEGMVVNFGATGSSLYTYVPFSSEAAPDYMDEAKQLTYEIDPSDSWATIEIEWEESVTVVDEDAISLPVYLNNQEVGTLDSTYMSFEVTGDNDAVVGSRSVETGESGTKLLLLVGASGLFQSTGEYTIRIPEGIFKNENGDINPLQNLTVVCEENVLAEGVLDPEDNSEFTVGEEVVITITYTGENLEENYSEDDPLMVYDNDEYDKTFTWTDSELTLDADNMQVIINLGDELEAGMYYISFREGSVLVDGVQNEGVYDYVFTVVEQQDDNTPGDNTPDDGDNTPDDGDNTPGDNNPGTSGISGIDADAEGLNVFTLQGVKVDGKNLAPGLYIINGNKVLVK